LRARRTLRDVPGFISVAQSFARVESFEWYESEYSNNPQLPVYNIAIAQNFLTIQTSAALFLRRDPIGALKEFLANSRARRIAVFKITMAEESLNMRPRLAITSNANRPRSQPCRIFNQRENPIADRSRRSQLIISRSFQMLEMI